MEPKSINLNKRKLIEETKREFVLFLDEYLQKSKDQKHNKKELCDLFKEQFSDFDRGRTGLTTNTFTKWCRLYAKYKSEYSECFETRSNGKSWIEFIKDKEPIPF